MSKKGIPQHKWSYEELSTESLKCGSREELKQSNIRAYRAILRRKDRELFFVHMPPSATKAWTDEELRAEALPYLTRDSFQVGSSGAYNAARDRGKEFLDSICSHMPRRVDQSGENNNSFKWSLIDLKTEAIKHTTQASFKEGNSCAYHVAVKRDNWDEISSHMVRPKISAPEKFILQEVQKYFPDAKKFRANKLSISGKGYIKTLEIDILVKELGKGIEYDSEHFHSLEGLMRGHPTWPEEDLKIYHEIKDAAFLTLGIEILHIKQEEWKKDKKSCIQRCLAFLGVSNERQIA